MSESSEASGASGVIEPDQADFEAAEAAMESEGVEVTEETTGGLFSGKTAWVRRMETPLRTFLRTETGSASVLAAPPWWR